MKDRKKQKSISFLLIIIIVLSAFLPFEIIYLISVGYIIFHLFLYKIPVSKKALFALIPLVIILIISCFGIVWRKNYTDIIRDIAYLSSPVLVFMIGYIQMLKIKDLKMFLKSIIIAGTALSSYHLFKLVVNLEVLTTSIREIRLALGVGYMWSVISLSILILYKYFNLEVFKRQSTRIICVILCSSSFLLSLSRSLAVVLFIFVIVFGYNSLLKLSKKEIRFKTNYKKLSLSLFYLLVLFMVILLINPFDSLIFNQLFQKIYNSFNEIKLSRSTDTSNFINNWRGYEGNRAVMTYDDFNPIQKIFGGGIGQLVKLDVPVMLEGQLYTEVPKIHNGYLYVLIKSGIFGVFLYVYFIARVLINGFVFQRNMNTKNRFIGKLVVSSILALAVITFVDTGVFHLEISFPFMLLIGTFYGYVLLLAQQKLT